MKKINKVLNLVLSLMFLNSCGTSFELYKVKIKSLYHRYKLLFDSKLSVSSNDYLLENRLTVKNKLFELDYCDIYIKEIGKIKNLNDQLYKVELDYYLVSVKINEDFKDYASDLVRSIVYYSNDEDVLEEVGYDIIRIFDYLSYIPTDDFNELIEEKVIIVKVDVDETDNLEILKIDKIDSEFVFIEV